ncbi:TIGR04211 family SH3 domain-containing protein [Marinobacter confluentis]|uniref:TIGR04211 family SH3 domain-containing protein n=2 Tax=Marinobacter confluentis TaxID=1697557 RepID=A0A4Z1C6U5_9GAMM|nr:TIGR04211 family SH3 domain-containing protein [Marinobacter confluentis]
MKPTLYRQVTMPELRVKNTVSGNLPVPSVRSLFCCLMLVFTVSSAFAETVYVDDTLYAPIRSGEGTQYRILHSGVRSGTPLELLERSESGYSRVRTPDGIEGWMVSRYLTETPIARERLEAANRQLAEARETVTTLRSELEAVTQERDSLRSSESSLEARAGRLSQELQEIKTVAADALNLNRRNEELSNENQKLRNELEVLTAEKERLEANTDSDFMLLGAGLVLLGIILALIVPALKPTRKTDNWA